jgi:hypothetical protein
MALGDPPIRPPAPKPADPSELVWTSVPGKPHMQRDQHGRLRNNAPTPCYLCGGRGKFCLLCGGN